MLQRILTGFAPFLDHAKNPSWEIAQQLALRLGDGNQAIELPVLFEQSFVHLHNILKKQTQFPNQLWLFGLAANRNAICLERVALNWIETGVPDNSGQERLSPQKIDPLGPDAILLSQHQLIDKGPLPDGLQISHTAGTYVCNDLYYRVLSQYKEYRQQIIFVHVPPLTSLTLDQQLQLLLTWMNQ